MTAELTPFADLIAIYAIVVTLFAAYVVYALWYAKRTIRLVGLAAKAKVAARDFEESAKKVAAEAEAIIRKAKAKVNAAPKKQAAKKPAVTQRKIVAPKK